MIVGKFPEFRQVVPNYTKIEKRNLQIYFNEVINIPLNIIVTDVRSVGGSTRKTKASVGLAKFHASGIDFEIEQIDEYTKLSAYSKSIDFCDITINRIFEAFSFITAHSESWSIITTYNIEKIETRIRTVTSRKLRSRILPPIKHQRAGYCESVWRIFECYLTYVLKNKKDYFHPISREIHSVIESGKASLDVEALTLAVSIESLLRHEMSVFYQKPEELNKNISEAKKIILASDLLDGRFKKRLMGSISAMSDARPKDILASLVNNNLIDEAIVKVYGKLRNRSAHGEKESGQDFQGYFNKISTVLVLFFQLIFIVIKYNGEYTDYGTYGFPQKKFPSKHIS